MERARLHLLRLERNFANAMQHFDEVAFTEIASTLRIWQEMAQPLVDIAPEFSAASIFKSARPSKQLVKTLRGHAYVLALSPDFLPTGMYPRSSGHGGSPVFGMRTNPVGDFSIGAQIKRDDQGRLQMKDPYFVDGTIEDQKAFEKMFKARTIERHNFRQWLNADAVRVGQRRPDGSIEELTISRSVFIKRVANTLDGSHASMAVQAENKFDPAVRSMLDLVFQGAPLPFFILLKIAEDILHFAPKYFERKPQ